MEASVNLLKETNQQEGFEGTKINQSKRLKLNYLAKGPYGGDKIKEHTKEDMSKWR